MVNDWIEEVRNYEFFISHSSSFKENWDFLIMITACYNVFMLPIGIAFRVKNQVFDLTSQAVDVIFVLDIFIVFRTTILDDDSGEEIRDGKVIASKYLKGRFTVDFLSTVPFDYIALVSCSFHSFKVILYTPLSDSLNLFLLQIFLDSASAKQFQLFGLLKLIRVLRLNRIIMYLNLK